MELQGIIKEIFELCNQKIEENNNISTPLLEEYREGHSDLAKEIITFIEKQYDKEESGEWQNFIKCGEVVEEIINSDTDIREKIEKKLETMNFINVNQMSAGSYIGACRHISSLLLNVMLNRTDEDSKYEKRAQEARLIIVELINEYRKKL